MLLWKREITVNRFVDREEELAALEEMWARQGT